MQMICQVCGATLEDGNCPECTEVLQDEINEEALILEAEEEVGEDECGYF